jgi:2-polyprenyl-3-methyl-5-hydroxy-6-metoxy-1,4-benzoquinol methylase
MTERTPKSKADGATSDRLRRFYDAQGEAAPCPARSRAVALLAARAITELARPRLELLDVGCGGGGSTLAVLAELETGFGVESARLMITGWDLSPTAVEAARQRGLNAELRDIESAELGSEPGGRFDLVLFSEVLEHLVNTGQALRNLVHLLRRPGYLVLTTPNLAAWHNRLLLAAGRQPHGTEVSFEPHRFGNRLFERLLGEPAGGVRMAGHLRLFTLRALREFLIHHDFEVITGIGVAPHGDPLSRLIARLWTGGAGDLAVLARSPSSGISSE